MTPRGLGFTVQGASVQRLVGPAAPSLGGLVAQASLTVDAPLSLVAHFGHFGGLDAAPSGEMVQWGVLLRLRSPRSLPGAGVIPFVEAGVLSQQLVRRVEYFDYPELQGYGLAIGVGATRSLGRGLELQVAGQWHAADTNGDLLIPPGTGDPGFFIPTAQRQETLAFRAGVSWRVWAP